MIDLAEPLEIIVLDLVYGMQGQDLTHMKRVKHLLYRTLLLLFWPLLGSAHIAIIAVVESQGNETRQIDV